MTRNRTTVRKCASAMFVMVIVSVLSSPLFAEERKAWQSWQIDNPAWTGVLSGVALGMWPAEFANDVKPASLIQEQAIADGALDFSRAHAQRAFRFWQGVTFAAIAALIIVGFVQWRRRSRRAHSASSVPA